MSIRLPSGPGALTERNREVLRLLERGMTNFEIATELGISLEGAKYHVREIMTRLNVESREEAVAAWRREQQPARRMRRAVLAMFAGKGGWASAAVVAAGLGVLAVVLALNLGGDESPPASPPESDATATSSPSTTSPSATATVSPTATVPVPTATPDSPVGPPLVPVTGMFAREPQDISAEPIVRQLGPRPDSPFEPFDGERVLIYDTETFDTIALGEGVVWGFSPDSEWVVWVDAPMSPGSAIFPMGIVTTTNLQTGEVRTFGPGSGARFIDDKRLLVGDSSNVNVVYDFATGDVSSDQSVSEESYFPSQNTYRWDVEYDATTELPRGGNGSALYRLVDVATNQLALEFEAVVTVMGGEGEIVVATPLEVPDGDVQNSMTNIFVVNIATGDAEFIARALYAQGPNWPLSATEDYVLWTESYCGPQGRPGPMRLFDRRTGTLIEIDDGVGNASEGDRFARLTPGGDIALGSFGASALIDAETMEFLVTLPGAISGVNGGDRRWSPDYRYAAYFRSGHGGLC